MTAGLVPSNFVDMWLPGIRDGETMLPITAPGLPPPAPALSAAEAGGSTHATGAAAARSAARQSAAALVQPPAGRGNPAGTLASTSATDTANADAVPAGTGFVFVCNSATYNDCIELLLFGLPAPQLGAMRVHIDVKGDTQTGGPTKLYLLNTSDMVLHGEPAASCVPAVGYFVKFVVPRVAAKAAHQWPLWASCELGDHSRLP